MAPIHVLNLLVIYEICLWRLSWVGLIILKEFLYVLFSEPKLMEIFLTVYMTKYKLK